MKRMICYFIFHLLVFSSNCFSQIKNETNTYETAEYSIAYPSKSKFVNNQTKEDDLLKSMFSIYDFGNELISDFSGISLSKIDCSGLGIGTAGIVQVAKKNNTSIRSWNEKSQTAFDEVVYEDDGFTYLKHIYVNKNIVYQLTASIKTEMFQENRDNIQKIFKSFFLK